MITMSGKYNTANIMIDNIDEATKEQIQEFLNHPAFAGSYIAIMPDCHAGKGAVVGFTMKFNDYIIPNVIGVDIGCGMLSAKFNISKLDIPALDNFIKSNIPSGFGINSSFREHYLNYQVRDICSRIKIDDETALKAIGSLGGGNHFIEVGRDSQDKIWVTVHSGSRNFGLKVANFYQAKAKENLEKYFIRDQYKNLEFLLVDSVDGRNYMSDLKVAQIFAACNRTEIMIRIASFLDLKPEYVIESVHNFIDNDGIIRKGATPAKLGDNVIIPFNMKDGIAICVGLGSAKYNFSAPHGAGRILSRKQAKLNLSLNEFQEQMKTAGVYTTTANESTLDEAPNAYKDKDIILQNIKETVDVIEFIKPMYNFKASD